MILKLWVHPVQFKVQYPVPPCKKTNKYLDMNCASCLVFKLSLTDGTNHGEVCISVRIVWLQVHRFELLQLGMHFSTMLSTNNKNGDMTGTVEPPINVWDLVQIINYKITRIPKEVFLWQSQLVTLKFFKVNEQFTLLVNISSSL